MSAEPPIASSTPAALPASLAGELLEECVRVVPSLDLRDIGARLLAPLVRATGSHRASLMLVNPASGRLRIVAGHGIRAELIGTDTEWRPHSIAEWVFRRGEGLVLHGEVRTEALHGIAEGGIDSSLCVPLLGASGPIGVLSLARSSQAPPFSDREREGVEALLPPLTAALERAERAVRAEGYAAQLESAPVGSLVTEGRTALQHHELGFARVGSPARHGAHAERVLHGQGMHSLLVTDALADGAEAAIANAFIAGAFAAAASPERTLSGLMAQLDTMLLARRPGSRGMAVWTAGLSPSGQLVSCNAGYPAPLWIPSDDSPVCRLAGAGPAIGAEPKGRWEEEQIRLLPGDVVLVASRGLLEARNVMGVPLGEERVIEAAAACRREPLDRLARAVLDLALAYSGRPVPVEDLQVLAIRFAPNR